MQIITFNIKWFNLILNNYKKTTIRLGKRDYCIGSVLFDFTEINNTIIKEIIYIKHIKFNSITEEMAVEDGYLNKSDLIKSIKEYYPDIKKDSIITYIIWK